MATENVRANARPTWDYHDKNIQGEIINNNFTRADRTVLFVRNGKKESTFKAVGLVQGFSHMEQKQLQVIFEMGSAKPMVIPGLTTGQLSLSRVLLNGYDFLNTVEFAIGELNRRPDGGIQNGGEVSKKEVLRSIRDVNRPFDIMISKYRVLDDERQAVPFTGEGAAPSGLNTTAMSTIIFKNCQIQSKSEQISAGGVVTLEQVSIFYESIPNLTFN